MVLNKTTYPSKWTDWNNTNLKELINYSSYILQLKHAILERITVANKKVDCPDLYNITQGAPTVADSVNALLNALRKIVPCFYKLSEEKDLDYNFRGFDFEEEPPFWTVQEMCAEPYCDISTDIEKNDLLIDKKIEKTFIAMYNVINKLRYVPILYPTVIKTYGFGEIHDPPFNESNVVSINKALVENMTRTYENKIPTYVSAWSGNVHYKKNYDGNGYCGYAEICAFILMNFLNRLPNRAKGLIFVSNTTMPDIEDLTYADEISETRLSIPEDTPNIFSGKFLKKETIEANRGLIFYVGDSQTPNIPENVLVPGSTFPETGEPYRRGTITGYKSKVFLFLDYGIDGGYRFFSNKVISY